MITFYNDHLVAPEFCQIIYATIPEQYHLPVVIKLKSQEDWALHGQVNGLRVELYLNGIYRNGLRGKGSTDTSLWLYLLWVTYHEFGHLVTQFDVPALKHYLYEEKGREWSEIESLADAWAYMKIAQLAGHDKRLAQPKHLGAYFEGRQARRRKGILAAGNKTANLVDWRCYTSGGQYSATDLLLAFHDVLFPGRYFYELPWSSAYRLVRKLAHDLGYPYIDRAGRKHLFYAHGDLPEIRRRFAAHRAVHPWTPPPRHQEDIEDIEQIEDSGEYRSIRVSDLFGDDPPGDGPPGEITPVNDEIPF